MSFIAAFQFLTSIPLPRRLAANQEALGRSAVYFPVVGLIIGLILAGLNWLFSLALPPAIVKALLLVALVIITGALHLDGFVDTCNGIAGHKAVEDRWRVMHDSRAGAFGIVGVALLLLVKYVALSNVPPFFMTATLIFMPVVSRWAVVHAIFIHPYAHSSGLGTTFKQATRWPQFTAATLITIIVALALLPLFSLIGLLIIPGVWIITALFSVYLKRKFSGLTGDTYGAINEVAEVAVLVVASLIVNTGMVHPI